MLRLAALAAFLASAAAFAPVPALPPRLAPSRVATARRVLMTEDEIAAILGKANDCVASECAIDETEDLIRELKAQQDQLQNRLGDLMNMVAALQKANEKEGRKTDDVRQLVKDLMRTFSIKDGKFAIGFSGEVGDGPSTAYDALPPKPWKADA